MKASEYIKQHGDFEITEAIEKCIPHKPKSVWDLEKGDICYGINIFNQAMDFEWCDSHANECTRSIGLITLTEEELEFKIEKMKVYEELKRFAKDFTNEEWLDTRIKKVFIYFSCPLSRIQFATNLNCKCHDLYFESEEKAEEAITAVGEERVKKYYLGVGK